MINVIFYDRKYDCEVSSEQLVFVNVQTDTISTDKNDDVPEYRGYHTLQLGELGYKSEDCDDSRNWDRYLMVSDLVFLRFE